MDVNQQPPNATQQAWQQQPNYQGAPGQAYAPVMSIKDWIITLIILIIPIVNIVMMFVWAFGQGNPNKQNYFKAYLILLAIGVVLYIVLAMLGLAVFGSILSNL